VAPAVPEPTTKIGAEQGETTCSWLEKPSTAGRRRLAATTDSGSPDRMRIDVGVSPTTSRADLARVAFATSRSAR